MNLDEVIALLAEKHQSVTYTALAELFEVNRQTYMKERDNTPQNSWVVAAKTGLPTGYSDDEIDPALRAFIENGGRPLGSVQDLRLWLLDNMPEEEGEGA
ncbi:MAG: hypothetical protein AAFV43_01350 [Planctomycetota bacterium]